MACFKKDGKGNYVRDEVKSTTPNLHGSAKAFKAANKVNTAAVEDKPVAVEKTGKKPTNGKGE